MGTSDMLKKRWTLMAYPLEHPLKTLQVITDCVHAQADISLDWCTCQLIPFAGYQAQITGGILSCHMDKSPLNAPYCHTGWIG